MTRAAQRYRAIQSARADQGRVLILLYEGAIRLLHESATAFEQRREDEAVDCLRRAEQILRELARSLDIAHGGSVARNLNRVYDYCSRRLADASLGHDPRPAAEVAGLLDDLLGAWRMALRKLAPAATNTNPITEERPQ